MMISSLTPEFLHIDDRGSLTQLVSGGYSQINILISNAGVTRGGHYHKLCREAFYIVGGEVEVSLEKNGEKETLRFLEGSFFEIAPYTAHKMCFPKNCIMVVLYDRPVETDHGKDIFAKNMEE